MPISVFSRLHALTTSLATQAHSKSSLSHGLAPRGSERCSTRELSDRIRSGSYVERSVVFSGHGQAIGPNSLRVVNRGHGGFSLGLAQRAEGLRTNLKDLPPSWSPQNGCRGSEARGCLGGRPAGPVARLLQLPRRHVTVRGSLIAALFRCSMAARCIGMRYLASAAGSGAPAASSSPRPQGPASRSAAATLHGSWGYPPACSCTSRRTAVSSSAEFARS